MRKAAPQSFVKQFTAIQKSRVILLIIVIFLIVLFVLGVLKFGWGWTGFPTKTLWDLMELLIVPVVLAFGALWFNREQLNREQWLAREHEEERSLQNYFDKMTELLLEKNLRGSKEGSEVRSIARVRTYTALRAVNEMRKTNIMWFLIQAGLIGETSVAASKSTEAGAEPEVPRRRNIVNLKGAPLSQTDLPYADLRGADLRFVHFRKANLAHARLDNAILFAPDLCGANLNMANLEGADLRKAKYDTATQWPDDFDPEQVGAVRVEE